jgi:hypothetical protein
MVVLRQKPPLITALQDPNRSACAGILQSKWAPAIGRSSRRRMRLHFCLRVGSVRYTDWIIK